MLIDLIHLIVLNETLQSENTFDIVRAYRDIIRFYLDEDLPRTAYLYLKEMIQKIDMGEIQEIHLFGEILEQCFEIICIGMEGGSELWKWAKPYLQERNKKYMYGNLYKKGIAAAKYMNDIYTKDLENAYTKWKKEFDIK